jgi:hypothetical protein
MYSLVAFRELLTVTSGYGASCILYTDGSLIEGCAGFAVHQMGVGGFGHKIPSLAGVFTAELSVLFTELRHGHDRRHWKAPSSTNHYFRAISRVWLDRH